MTHSIKNQIGMEITTACGILLQLGDDITWAPFDVTCKNCRKTKYWKKGIEDVAHRKYRLKRGRIGLKGS